MTSVASLPGSKTASVVRDSCFVSMTNGTIAVLDGCLWLVPLRLVFLFRYLLAGTAARRHEELRDEYHCNP